MPVDPSFAISGGEWSVGLGGLGQGTEAGGQVAGGDGFASALGTQLQNLADLQTDAASASQSLAAGTATDPAEVVMAVERARLAMQLASQIRTKSVEAINDIFHTQV
jgi:flagellar hook-basal body complex protein FliE